MAEADASLIIDLQARTAKLEKDLDRANAKIHRKVRQQGQTLTRDLSTMFSKLGTIAAFAGVTVGLNQIRGAVLDVIDTSSQLQTTADKLGLTTTALQELRYAGEQFNINQQTTDMALQRFSRRLAEAAQGGGELKATLDQYGIAVRDSNGQMRDTLAVLRDYADEIQDAESNQERLRMAFKAFDSEGVSFVNILREGSEGLAKYTMQAHAFGQVVEAQQIRRLAELDSRLTDISGKWATFKTEMVSGALDVGEFLGLGGAMNDLKGLQSEIDTLQIKMSLPANAANPTSPYMEMLQEDLDDAVIKQEVALSKLVRNIHDTRELINTELGNALANQQAFDPASDPEGYYELFTRRIGRLQKELDKLDATEREAMAKYPELAGLLQELNNLEEGRANALALTADETARLNAILASTITPLEHYEAKIQLLERAMEAMPGRTAEFEEAMKRVTQAYEESLKDEEPVNVFIKNWDDMSERLPQSLSEAFVEGDGAVKDFLARTLRRLAAAQLEAAIIAPFLGLFGFGGKGSTGTGIFGTGIKLFGDGGRPTPGQPAIFGERGAELWVPDQPGTVISNRDIAGMIGTASTGGDTFNQTFHLHFDVGLETVDNRIRQSIPAMTQAAKAAINDEHRRRPF